MVRGKRPREEKMDLQCQGTIGKNKSRMAAGI